MKAIYNSGKYYGEIFDSVQEFINELESRNVNARFDGRALASEGSNNKGFYATENIDEANKLLNEGDRGNFDKLQKVMINGVPASNKTRTQLRSGVVGCMPIVPKYITGVPNNMLQVNKIKTPAKVISIVVNCTAAVKQSSEDIIIFGAKIASIIQGLERNGIRVNLYCGCSSSNGKNKDNSGNIEFAIKIKDAGSPFNLLRIAYPVINPSFLRRHSFQFIEKVKDETIITDRILSTYGKCTPFSKNILSSIPGQKKVVYTAYLDLEMSLEELTKRVTE